MSLIPRPPRPSHPPRPALWLAVALALVLAQGLGLMHRVLHAPQLAAVASPFLGAAGPAVVPAWAAAATPQGDALPALTRLFADHEPSGCESYDQLSHADVLWSASATVCAPALGRPAPAPHAAWRLAAQAAGYLARGPPPHG